MNPRTVEDVVMDFKGRRLGLIKALTTDVEKFYQSCDPNYLNKCLYGYPNEQWDVILPPPLDLPEPRLGINFSRSGMKRQDWLSMVALHSDAWLHSIVGFWASKLKLDKADRKRLFNKIADFPSISKVTSNELTRKRVKIENCGIPEEIFIEILSRVPAKDLITYRCVSKMWRSLIDDTDFIHTHLNNYKANLEGTHLLVMESPRAFYKDRKVLVRRSDTYRQVAKFDYLDGHGRHDNSKCLSYINGVILLRKGNLKSLNEISLWNPSINRSLRLPNCVFQSLKDASYFELALGFDASHNDYKVIAIVYPHAETTHFHDFGCHKTRYHGTVPGLVQVFSLCSNSWSCYLGIEPPPHWTVGKQVFFNGAIHWTNLGISPRANNSGDSHVVLFNVANEVFSYFKMPEYDNDQQDMKDSFLTVLDKSLALFRGYEYENDIFVMKEYGVAKSWSKLYSFTREIEKLLYFTSKGELLYINEWKNMIYYNFKQRFTRQLTRAYNKTSKYKFYTYVESLVLFGR